MVLAAAPGSAQELIPAAYTPAPVGVNLVSVATASNRGDVAFDPSGPIDEASADILVSSLSYARTFGLAGRSANLTLIAPWVVGDLEGLYRGEPASASRSGPADLNLRLGVNLYGGPAMSPQQFAKYRPKTLIGASLIVVAPTGEYDSTKLINIGTNRWGFRPEVGVVHVMGRWVIDASVGGWLYTDNTDFAGGRTRRQDAILSSQFHVRCLLGRGLWGAVGANYWRGGRTTVDGVVGDDLQENSRVGVTLAWQAAPSHALRFAASRGAFTRIGGDFDSFGLSYSYTWRKKPAPG